MKVVLFIVCLGYLLIGGYNHLHTSRHTHHYASTLQLKKDPHFIFADNASQEPVVKAAIPDDAAGFLFEDLEEEDTNDSAAKKYRILASFLYAYAGTFLLSYLHSRFKSARPCYRLLTNKYIVQRVLRI